MNCECHDEPMLWAKASSRWFCRIEHRAYQRRWYAANPNLEKVRERHRLAGGPDTLANVQATCPSCNLRKGSKLMTELTGFEVS